MSKSSQEYSSLFSKCNHETWIQRSFGFHIHLFNVFPIQLPPLRERLEDLDLLVQHFVERGNKRLGRDVRHVPTAVLEQLRSYSWPGNVRELQNAIERALILAPRGPLRFEGLGGLPARARRSGRPPPRAYARRRR